MDYNLFNHTLDMASPPDNFIPELKAMWWERKNYWDKGHDIIQNIPGKDAAWVHAYMHRKEGDISNASYWYNRAGRQTEEGDIVEEFRAIVMYLLEKN